MTGGPALPPISGVIVAVQVAGASLFKLLEVMLKDSFVTADCVWNHALIVGNTGDTEE